MKQIAMLLVGALLMGCGGSSSQAEKSVTEADNNVSEAIHDPYFNQQWYLAKNEVFNRSYGIDPNASIHWQESLVYKGEGVTIAVIDDGLDIYHPDLSGSIVATYSIIDGSADVSHRDTEGYHGTAVTGIIAANENAIGIKGVASRSRIIFLQYKEGMSDSETIELFQRAQMLGADVINCSWGTYDVSDSVKSVIQDLSMNGRDGKGIPIVFAVGNDNREMGNDESAIAEVIAVGATDRENLRAWYSNYGSAIDVVAPGGYEIGMTTLDISGEDGAGEMDDDYLLFNDTNAFIGTSASAPIVTGLIALMIEKKPSLRREEIERILHEGSDKIGDMEYVNGFNQYYGYGKVNVQKVLGVIK